MFGDRFPRYGSVDWMMGHGMRIIGNVHTNVEMVSRHHRYSITNDQMPHFQGIIKNDNSMTDGKLLSNNKMPLMANQPLHTSISNINITSSMS